MKKSFPLKTKPNKYYMVTVQFDTEPYFQINRVVFTHKGIPLIYFKFNYEKDLFTISVGEIDRTNITEIMCKAFIAEFTPRMRFTDYMYIQYHCIDETETYNISVNHVANELLFNIWTIIKDGNYNRVTC